MRLHAEYEARGVTVIGIAVDSGSEPAIRSFADEFGVNYPIWLTGGAIATGEFGAIGYPFTLLVDGDGLIRNQLLGPQDYETLEAEIERLRSETG